MSGISGSLGVRGFLVSGFEVFVLQGLRSVSLGMACGFGVPRRVSPSLAPKVHMISELQTYLRVTMLLNFTESSCKD